MYNIINTRDLSANDIHNLSANDIHDLSANDNIYDVYDEMLKKIELYKDTHPNIYLFSILYTV